VIVFRQADSRYPFLWSDPSQPAARWHGEGEGPAHYFADTPDGAWAELLRHEEIATPEDAATLRRALWAVEVGDDPSRSPALPEATMVGGLESYGACQEYARRARQRGVRRLAVPSAALVPGGAGGRQVVDGVERPAEPRFGQVIVVFGQPAELVGWRVVEQGAPPSDLLPRVRPLPPSR
jgi:hypothetical protein